MVLESSYGLQYFVKFCKLFLVPSFTLPDLDDKVVVVLICAQMYRDPFIESKDEVYSEMKVINALHAKWCQSCMTGDLSQSDMTMSELVEHLEDVAEILDDMETTISIVERDRSKFSINDEEIQLRWDFVTMNKSKIRDIRDDLVVRPSRVFSSIQSNKEKKYKEAIFKENEAFISNEQRQQGVLYEEHEEHFDKLFTVVTDLGAMARAIGDETNAQNELITSTARQSDKTSDMARESSKNINKLMTRMQANVGWICIGISIGILILVSVIALGT